MAKERVIRAILSFTNTPSGGQIIIGVKEDDHSKSLILHGVTEDQFESFKDTEAIKGIVDGFSTVSTLFDINYGVYQGKKYVIINIQEFDEIPTLCKKDGQDKKVLCKDDLYCRSKKPHTAVLKLQILS